MAAGWLVRNSTREREGMGTTLETERLFVSEDEGAWTDLGNGLRRRVRVNLPELMMVEFAFEPRNIPPSGAYICRRPKEVS